MPIFSLIFSTRRSFKMFHRLIKRTLTNNVFDFFVFISQCLVRQYSIEHRFILAIFRASKPNCNLYKNDGNKLRKNKRIYSYVQSIMFVENIKSYYFRFNHFNDQNKNIRVHLCRFVKEISKTVTGEIKALQNKSEFL